eukprot:scaffold50749_cov25-Tisochrysis_lutea.AAC.1
MASMGPREPCPSAERSIRRGTAIAAASAGESFRLPALGKGLLKPSPPIGVFMKSGPPTERSRGRGGPRDGVDACCSNRQRPAARRVQWHGYTLALTRGGRGGGGLLRGGCRLRRGLALRDAGLALESWPAELALVEAQLQVRWAAQGSWAAGVRLLTALPPRPASWSARRQAWKGATWQLCLRPEGSAAASQSLAWRERPGGWQRCVPCALVPRPPARATRSVRRLAGGSR